MGRKKEEGSVIQVRQGTVGTGTVSVILRVVYDIQQVSCQVHRIPGRRLVLRVVYLAGDGWAGLRMLSATHWLLSSS